MENKNLITKIKDLMQQYGFLATDEPEYNSFKLTNEMFIQIVGEIEVDKEIFSINEGTGEREVLTNGIYQNELLRFEVIDGKIISVNERFAEVKTMDGIVLKVDGDVVVGSAILVVTDQGDVPAPDGEYELEDGTKISTVGGLIEEVSTEAPEEPVTGDTQTPAPADMPMIPSEMEQLFEMLKAFMGDVSEKMSTMDEQLKKCETKLSQTQSEFNQFKKEPAGTKIPNGKVEMSIEEDTKLSKILQLRNKK